MTSSEALRKEILNKMWSNPSVEPHRSPEFLKWLGERIKKDRSELLTEILSELDTVGTYYEAIEVISSLKNKIK